MPSSTDVGKSQAVEMLDALGVLSTAHSVLDVGAGMGTWYDRLAPLLPGATWDAIEAWEPWADRFNIRARYDRVFIEDAITMDTSLLRPSYDIVIYGDVLEHMSREDGIRTVKRLRGRAALLSIPMAGGIHEFQEDHMHDYGTGEDFSCQYERHLASWTAQMVRDTFNVAAEWVTQDIGVFIIGLDKPPAVTVPGDFAIMIPSRNRPYLMEKLVANIRAVTPEPYGLYFAVTDQESFDILESLGVDTWLTDPAWSAPQRAQFLYEQTNESFFYVGQDDSLFHEGWLEPGLAAVRKIDGLVAVNDLYNPNGTTAFVSRRYVQEESCAPDEFGVIAHRGYHHDWAETEAFEVAKTRSRFAYCADSVVEHLHYSTGKTPFDKTYAESERWARDDEVLFLSRRHLWAEVT